jgi:hypothetical protein
MAKHGKKGGETRKGGSRRKAATSEAPGGGTTQLVPWDPLENVTDSMRIPRVLGSVYTTCKTTVTDSAIVQSSTQPTIGAITYTLAGNCQDYSSYTGAFDQYRILMAETIFRPRANVSQISSTNGLGTLYTVIDYDDASTVSGLALLANYENCIITAPYQQNRRCLKPRCALAAYSGTFTSYANVEAPWIDAASPSVIHYGLKYGVDAGSVGDLQSWDTTTRVVFQFRASR